MQRDPSKLVQEDSVLLLDPWYVLGQRVELNLLVFRWDVKKSSKRCRVRTGRHHYQDVYQSSESVRRTDFVIFALAFEDMNNLKSLMASERLAIPIANALRSVWNHAMRTIIRTFVSVQLTQLRKSRFPISDIFDAYPSLVDVEAMKSRKINIQRSNS